MAGLMAARVPDREGEVLEAPDRAENPTETLDYSYEQMLQQLQNVKRGVADVVTAKKRLELQTQSIEQNVVKLETQARQASRRTARISPARRSSARPPRSSSSRGSTRRCSSSPTSRRSSSPRSSSSRRASSPSARRRK